MAQMPSYGALKASKFKQVFSASNPVRWSQMYRGGTYVPSTLPSPTQARYESVGRRSDPNNIIIDYSDGYTEYKWDGTTQLGGYGFASQGNIYRKGVNGLYYKWVGTGEPFGDTVLFVIEGFQYIPSGTVQVPVNTGVPTSGSISFSDLYSAQSR